MNTEFHYYITGMVARAAGFTEDEARIIATELLMPAKTDPRYPCLIRW